MPAPEMICATIAFALVHYLSPFAANRIGQARAFRSFSAGLAISYVFLHLIPELDEGHELLGARIYFVALIGFCVLYGVRHALHRLRDAAAESAHFAIHMSYSAVYTALLMFTLGATLPDTISLTVVFVTSIGMHLLASDVGMAVEFGDRFRTRGRYILVGAVALGFAFAMIRDPRPVAVDFLTAILAGFMLFIVFREELPDVKRTRLRAFLAGVLVFGLLHILLEVGETVAGAGGG